MPALLLSPLEAASPKRDYAAPAAAWSILPPGENGTLTFDRNTTDQEKLYDGLTPLRGAVTQRDLRRFFKPARLGLGADKPRKRERPRAGVTIVRDSFGVAHVAGKNEVDVAFGAGWVTAADRGLLLQLIRGPARAAALDVPGLDPLALALSGRTFVPSADAEAFLSNQLDALRAQGATGRRLFAIVNAYAAGVNAWYRAKGIPAAPFTANDVVASTALIAGRFGANGGREVENSMFLQALEERLGESQALRVFADLHDSNDGEAPVSIPGSFPYELPAATSPGSVVVDDGSFVGVPFEQPPFASNALLVAAKRSETGHPLFVAGPQVGYFFPQFFAEMELQGAGFATRGAVFPGVPFVLIGRGPDYAWSATSSQADNIDLFVETLCTDDRHYVYRGQCTAMRRVFAGTLKAQGAPDQPVAYYQTTHGPVVGYATVAGKRVAISSQRSTRGRELLSSGAFYELNTARVTSARGFLRTMSAVEFSFNWFYADDRDIAFFSSGRLPLRAPGTDPALPTAGTGEYDWRGFLPLAGHAQVVNPPSGLILNWNNKPAADVGSADSNFAYGSVHRVELLRPALAARRKHTLAGVTGAMNAAATQDLRATDVWPAVRAVLRTGNAPSARAEAAVGPRGLVACRGFEPARPRPRWKDRRSGSRSPGCGLAAVGRRGDVAGVGAARRPAGTADGAKPQPWRGRLRIHLGLVRVRRQGPEIAARPAGASPVLAALLRSRGPRHLPRRPLGSNRRRSRRARELTGPGAVRLARRRSARAHPFHVGRAAGHDAVDEPPYLPAAHVVLRAPPPLNATGGIGAEPR